MTHPFKPLEFSGHRFSRDDVEPIAHWLIVGTAPQTDLWSETNLYALKDRLEQANPPSAVTVRTDDLGYAVLLIDPDLEDIVADAEALNRVMHYKHLDEALYEKALNEAIDQLWDDLDISDRIDIHNGSPIDTDRLWGNTCPDHLRATLRAMLPGHGFETA